MNAISTPKIVAAALLAVVAIVGARAQARLTAVAPNDAASAIVLVPETLAGGTITKRWTRSMSGPIVEDGAVFSAPGRDPVQLDFHRNSRSEHNGAGCYFLQGELVLAQSLRSIKHKSGSALFDVATLRADRSIRLIAATECKAAGCSEVEVGFGAAPWHGWRLSRLLGSDSGAVVPLSIAIEHSIAEDNPGAIADLQADLFTQLEHAVAELDLAPAQRLAAALDATGQ